ncbi:MAG: bacillithiol system redox-active protein YtxJ [Cytophagales bacterium]|nr:bacillithiol system redox-active protein YtxJ [Cytophagales bacterium]
MSFLSRLMGGGSVREDWQEITSIDDLDQAEHESHNRSVIIFKHSVICGVSERAKYRLEDGYDLDSNKAVLYYLDLLAYRDISNEIAHRFGIIHQSPQIIIIENGQAIFNTSHHSVSLDTLKQNLVA